MFHQPKRSRDLVVKYFRATLVVYISIMSLGTRQEVFANDPNSLLDHLSQARVEMSIKGESRWVLLMQSPGELTTAVTKVAANSQLHFGVGISQDVWLADGDGMTFSLSVRAPGGDVATEIFSRYIDAKHQLEDQQWFDEELSLRELAGRELEFVFTTTPGNSGDSQYDLGGWSGLEIVRIRESDRANSGVPFWVAIAGPIFALICLTVILKRLEGNGYRARAVRLVFSLTVLAIPVVYAAIPYLPMGISPAVGIASHVTALLIVASALILLMCRSRNDKRSRFFAAIDLVLFNFALVALLTETTIRAVPLLIDSPLVASGRRSQTSTIEKLNAQLEPLKGVTYENGLSFNSLGFPDREFAMPKPRDTYRITALIDSFGVMPQMPYEFNHLTLLEQELAGFAGSRKIDVTNLGMVGSSPADYLALLEELGKELSPDLVAMYFFVGNDYVPFGSEQAFTSRWDRFETYRVFSRLRRTSRINLQWDGSSDGNVVEISIPDYVNDWRLEEPVIPRDAFLQLEQRRARFFDPTLSEVHFVGAIRYAELIADLANELTGVPLVIFIVPEEMQVDSRLRREVQELMGKQLDVSRPGRYLRKHLAPLGEKVIVMDLLPRFQSEQQRRERVYFPQETHWNAAGNRIAAEEAAAQLRSVRERLVK